MDLAVPEDKALAKTEEMDEESILFFSLSTSGEKTPKQLADEYGYSLKTAYNRISRGREIVEGTIKTIGAKYLADVWKKYEYIWEEAKRLWGESGNVVYLKEMRSVLEAYRKMLSLDAPIKAAVNEEGKVVPDTLVLVFSDQEYIEREKNHKETAKTIEGEFNEVVP